MLKCFQIIVNTHNLDMGDPKKGNANIKAIWYILVRICTISIGGGIVEMCTLGKEICLGWILCGSNGAHAILKL